MRIDRNLDEISYDSGPRMSGLAFRRRIPILRKKASGNEFVFGYKAEYQLFQRAVHRVLAAAFRGYFSLRSPRSTFVARNCEPNLKRREILPSPFVEVVNVTPRVKSGEMTV